MKLLWVGDVYGSRGLESLKRFLPALKRDLAYHLLVINGENVADGLGIRMEDYKTIMSLGTHMITLGNHGFSKRDVLAFIDDANLVRPLNYPHGTPGQGVRLINYNGQRIAVMSVMGRVFMHDPLDNPFVALDTALSNLEADRTIVEVHAEATSEKLAIAHYLDGRVDAVVGTHTHVQTNDAMRLPKGTLYMTDLGMTGVKYGILGADKDKVMHKFLTGMPVRLQPSEDTVLQLNAALLDFEAGTIRPIHISD
ncbi:MAG: YmdB family metallophosphoesterase [Acholeplasmatales bacterium]|nr:MAG: YmdB family metallophosphoesterase [Acholeplasmatales bacterium]